MAKRRRSRLYQRHQGGVARYYADFRDFGDVGGKREALVPEDASSATTDERLAQALVAVRLRHFEELRRCKVNGGGIAPRGLKEYASHHVSLKERSGTVTQQWLEAARMHLDAAVEFFLRHESQRQLQSSSTARRQLIVGDRDLRTIRVEHVQQYAQWLCTRTNQRGSTLSSSSQRKYLNSLSNLFRRAMSERCVELGHNPVAALMEKPQEGATRRQSNWLEVPDAALLLAAMLSARAVRQTTAIPPEQLHAIVATMLLTGGRPSEVLGLEVADISFERKTVCFRPNSIRHRLKTLGSERVVRLWPQLEAILLPYVASLPHGDGALFPSPRTQTQFRDLRKAIDRAAQEAGWPAGSIRPYAFRHTYCAARLQTLDRGAPVSAFTVARELGHGGSRLVERVYGHLGTFRHRSEVVEYLVP